MATVCVVLGISKTTVLVSRFDCAAIAADLMPIRLQTARGTDIENEQGVEISTFERNWMATLAHDHPQAVLRTSESATYNCHGMTFASRRTQIWSAPAVRLILVEDSYTEITDVHDVLPGDVVVYYGDDGDPSHSGNVVENAPPLFVPRIVSKWGKGPELVHLVWDVSPVYGTNRQYFRCRA
jgi:hypothetical protein